MDLILNRDKLIVLAYYSKTTTSIYSTIWATEWNSCVGTRRQIEGVQPVPGEVRALHASHLLTMQEKLTKMSQFSEWVDLVKTKQQKWWKVKNARDWELGDRIFLAITIHSTCKPLVQWNGQYSVLKEDWSSDILSGGQTNTGNSVWGES